MSIDVAIDNDFLNHLLEIKKCEDLVDLIIRFFEELNVSPYMHQFVYENEAQIIPNRLLQELIGNDTIKIAYLNTIFNGSQEKRDYYRMIVLDLYRNFTGEEYPCRDVFSGWKAQHSLGEVHTVALCSLCSWTCFLSDDRDAKDLSAIMQSRFTHPIRILIVQNVAI